MTTQAAIQRAVPAATIARLPGYLRELNTLIASGVGSVASENLAQVCGVSSAKLRKDLSHLGSYGTRGVGYDVAHLASEISRELGLTQHWSVVIVGMGNLGRALAAYAGFAPKGFSVVAALDHDPAVVGTQVAGLVVEPMSRLVQVAQQGVSIGVIATPAASCQDVCDAMVEAGISSILTFAQAVINVPPGVDVRRVDLSTELQILAYHEQRKAASKAAHECVEVAL